MASPRDNRFNIGDKVHIAGMISTYRINKVEYDVKRAEFKYLLEGHLSWVFEHVLTKIGGDKVVKDFKKGREYECLEWVGNAFTVGHTYKSPKDGCLKSNNENKVQMAIDNYKKFKHKGAQVATDDWDETIPLPDQGTKGDDHPIPGSNGPDDDWDVADEVIPRTAAIPQNEKLLDVDIKTEMKHMFPMPILLEGPVGVGKSTLVMELAKELGLEYFASVLTDGTSKNEFTGYKNVMDGSYIGGEFRRCYEFGGLYNLEELNATSANLPIIFNTCENGYFVFADKTVKAHPDFRLVATMNTITNAKDFGGRRELDLSVRSRFHRILMKKADDSRFKPSTLIYAEAVNQILEANGITLLVDPRDMARFEHMRKNKDISPEVCLYKCMFNEKMDINEDKLRTIIKSGGEWNDK